VATLRVGVIFGGRSAEHEVSVVSAASVFAHLRRDRYAPVPIRIEKDGRWVLAAREPVAASPTDAAATRSADDRPVDPVGAIVGERLDVVFPVLHGPYGEDGTVQGLLELLDMAYVGAGVLGSAAGMDKAVSKTLFAAAGLPIVGHVTVLRQDWERDPARVTARVSDSLRYPVFVKPANLGSSVGISKTLSPDGLAAGVGEALQFDDKIVVESGVPNAREIECAVLGNDDPVASLPGEIIVTHADGFYSYDAKYLDSTGATPEIPAAIGPETSDEIRRLSIEAFRVLDLAGMARVDFFLGERGDIYLNEVNTIPGFTAISMYPKMWQATGLPYPDLLDRLVTLALERHARRRRLRTSRL